ncbi:membrane-bound lytic murein transglycosylase MltF [Kushneria phyllosphaerae]|uniref:Membrane-bound lytic murein transglycosylase F n=1 Tax=Kushneria phyllosphaerae TaxID=2100822 RepID=A0A2R8CLE7_9GAMM|nr:membrane-bound lytic murein transglycosylase MltF [Kushneria phyllosphaerae]SPJ33725.1 Membrane-bound lytic murein transglycosylase F [Kushneria phyllosphaerae]
MHRHLLRTTRQIAGLVVALLLLLTPARAISTWSAALMPMASPTTLSDVKQRDFLEIATRNTPATFYEGRQGPTGFEFELFRRFADELGVSLAVEDDQHISDVLDNVANGRTDIGAAGLVLDRQHQDVTYSQPIMSMQPMVAYRRGTPAPKTIKDLDGLDIGTVAGAGTSRVLHELQRAHPTLTWRESPDLETTDLLAMVESGELDAAVVYAHEFKLSRLFFPDVARALTIGNPVTLAWAFPAHTDPSLVERANDFIDRMRSTGDLALLTQKYFGHDDYLEYVGARRFIAQARSNLDQWMPDFKRAAGDTGFDWKLLAAVGYQESHWEPDAVSPTGVKGLMMLTRATASHMDVDDREDPQQSIDGGARYLRYLHDRIPEDVAEPDRTWMTLAAYNLGLGHLYDARRLARLQGHDPDQWDSVRQMLPLLQESSWYNRVEHGFARGSVAALYVRNIKRYEEILNWVERSQHQFSSLARATASNTNPPVFETVPPVP